MPAQALLIIYEVEPRPGQPLQEARDRMIDVLRRRTGGWGDSRPEIRARGEREVEIGFYSARGDLEMMRGILERPGVLGFHAVDSASPWLDELSLALGRWSATRSGATVTVERGYDDVVVRADILEELEAFAATLPELPAGRILGFQKEDHRVGGAESSTRWRLYLLHAEAPVHGGHIVSVDVATDEYDGAPRIALQFSAAGGAAFADLTEALVQQSLAIVLDGRVMSAPRVMERISGGRAQITMGSGRPYQELFDEARDLAVVLRAGGHPAGLRRLSEEVVGDDPQTAWQAMGPLPFTAQALALLLTIRYGCR